ncbi:MAG: type II toxin-antitoxin system RelE/ParE family toxin [Candidatus Hydrogenedentes bacterium]|nr:type II toxin-antitoxin system RelE/ParE family toxin [Candidatus Hydrogenedentota bacterium]
MHPAAGQGDVLEQALCVGQDRPVAAEGFLDAVEHACAALADLPEMGAPRHFDSPALCGVHMWCIRGFEKHLIFYRPLDTGIDVIRVLHAGRDIPNTIIEDVNA